jgi:transposase
VLRHRFNWKRVSMAGALAYRRDGRRARLYFQTCPDSYNDERLIEFVRHLRRHFRGEHVILIWDGLPSNRSARMRRYLDEQRHWLEVERLPAYAPELNPVEGLWANLKGRDLANRCEERIDDLADVAHRGARRVRHCQDLLFGFLRHAGLALGTD